MSRASWRALPRRTASPHVGKAYDYEYLRPTRVLGQSFAHVQDSLFEDGESVYVQAAHGLLRLEGALPGMTTDLGALSLNNGRIFHRGQAIRRQPDAATLRHIGHDLYADDRRVYPLRHEMDGIHSHPDLRILQDADAPGSGTSCRTPFSDDEQRVWLNGEPIHGVTPRAIKLMVCSSGRMASTFITARNGLRKPIRPDSTCWPTPTTRARTTPSTSATNGFPARTRPASSPTT